MSRLIPLLGFLIVAASFSACTRQPKKNGTIWQVSPISALLEGCFDGRVDFREIKKHGDFGIGALDGVDGELIGLDGRFLQIKGDGQVLPVPDTMTSPYAIVTFFEPARTADIGDAENYVRLEAFLDSLIETKNIFFAVKIEGEFAYVKARSIPRQKRPYRPLVEVIKDQSVFEFSNLKGTLVGFRCPPYQSGLNYPGYHFHFINEARTAGGHVMELKIIKAKVEIDPCHSFSLALPDGGDFYGLDLSKDKEQELKKVQARSGSE
jgi:acetolactate decarboxylase